MTNFDKILIMVIIVAEVMDSYVDLSTSVRAGDYLMIGIYVFYFLFLTLSLIPRLYRYFWKRTPA